MRARYYDPATGQFLSRDPLTAMTGAPYSYVYGNPLNMVDPLGLWSWKKALGVVSTVAGVVAVSAFVVGTLPVSAGVLATAGTVALVAGGVSTAATTVHAGIECTDGGPRGDCVSDLVNLSITGVSLGLGRGAAALSRSRELGELAESTYIYRDVFRELGNGYSAVKALADRFWPGRSTATC